ncbi:MAG: MarR family transcriptional regulator [Proteobacteria bacterium]|nr:MarR family transcriptional regulator [Pseudomonadota bacterium]
MKTFLSDINDALIMLGSLENDLAINNFKPNEKKVFYTIVILQESSGHPCNISDVVEHSGLSRSSVYKTLKKLVSGNIIELEQSRDDKREFLIKFC